MFTWLGLACLPRLCARAVCVRVYVCVCVAVECWAWNVSVPCLCLVLLQKVPAMYDVCRYTLSLRLHHPTRGHRKHTHK